MSPIEEERQRLLNDFAGVIELASNMRNLLEQCRNESLPLHLAKEIDRVLAEAKSYD